MPRKCWPRCNAGRIALENYIAIAPGAVFPLGGYPGEEDAAREKFQKLDQAKTKEDFPATRMPDLDAALAFYGSAPALEDVPRIFSAKFLPFRSFPVP